MLCDCNEVDLFTLYTVYEPGICVLCLHLEKLLTSFPKCSPSVQDDQVIWPLTLLAMLCLSSDLSYRCLYQFCVL